VSPWFSDALLRAQTDERLVALVQDGHERAFVAIVERYRRPLLAFTRRLAGDARAEDVLQQAYLNAWVALSRGAEVRHLRGWLHQIVRNAALAARAPGEDRLPDTMIDHRDTPGRVEERLLIAQTLENLAALPDHQREAIVKTVMEGRSREEVASSLGVTEGAVRAMLHRARTTLRSAATAITPLPLAVWAANAADRGAEVAAGGGAAGLAAAATKAGAVVAVTGAVAGTVAGGDRLLVHHHRTPTQAPTAEIRLPREPAARPAEAAPVRRAVIVRHAAPAVTRPAATDRATPLVAPAPAHRVVVRHTTATRRAPAGDHTTTTTTAHPVPQQPGDDGEHRQAAAPQPAVAASTDETDHADGGGDGGGGGDTTSSGDGGGDNAPPTTTTTTDGGSSTD
jgi:RNA polymerase sigma factor (sigma-70 family)